MKSVTRVLALMSIALAAQGCVGSRVIVPPKSACSTLVPESWEKGVGSAGFPAAGSTDLERLKSWTEFAVEQTARLMSSDGRLKDTIGIIRRCEERDMLALEKARPRFLGVF